MALESLVRSASLDYSDHGPPNILLKSILRSTVCVPTGGLDNGYHAIASFDVYSMLSLHVSGCTSNTNICGQVDWTIQLIVINSKLSGANSFQTTMEYCFGRLGLIAISVRGLSS